MPYCHTILSELRQSGWSDAATKVRPFGVPFDGENGDFLCMFCVRACGVVSGPTQSRPTHWNPLLFSILNHSLWATYTQGDVETVSTNEHWHYTDFFPWRWLHTGLEITHTHSLSERWIAYKEMRVKGLQRATLQCSYSPCEWRVREKESVWMNSVLTHTNRSITLIQEAIWRL